MSSLLAANTVDAAALADELARFRVIEPNRLTELLSEFSGGGSVALVEFLVHRGVLTPFQADRALAGESRALTLGPYRVTGVAGSGVFGPVFSATRSDKPGAFRLRLFPLRSLWRARQAKQLARTLASAQHPSVVHLIDADSANGMHYLVWPQVEGESLMDRVAKCGPLPAAEVIALASTLADALHACHLRKVIHGALTPHSVVVDSTGFPRLLEVGAGAVLAANLADDESLLDTISAAIAATEILKYAAPEYHTDPAGTAATDQYALGAIAYFALTGQPPFASISLTDWLAAKTTGQLQPLGEACTEIPAQLAAIIERMLAPTPGDRFSGLDEVHDRLSELAATLGVPTQPLETIHPAPEEEPQQLSRHEPLPSGAVSWHGSGSGVLELPTRDDSDASINFELPPPAPEEFFEFPAARNAFSIAAPLLSAPKLDTPSRIERETEPSPSLDVLQGRRDNGPSLAPPPTAAGGPHPISPSPASPIPRKSPAQLEDLHMANQTKPESGERSRAKLEPPRPTSDPRSGLVTPVHYHTESPSDAAQPQLPEAVEERTNDDSVLWKKLKRSLLFWQAPMEVVQVSVYGPAAVTPGQPAKISVYLHTPESMDSVRTLSRAFHHDSELLGCGSVAREIARETELGVHLSVANAGVAKSLLNMVWRGQPYRLVFDLHVPWESPSGLAPGLISIGRENVRIGKIDFRLKLLPRRG
jgi:serine/threonine protein kinase